MDKKKIHKTDEKQLHKEQLPTDKSASTDEILSEEERDNVSGGIALIAREDYAIKYSSGCG